MKIRTLTSVALCNIVLALCAVTAFGQMCPTVKVVSPTDLTLEGGTITFTANVTGGDDNVSPTFNWSISAGTISSGQGTPVIWVDTTGAGGQSITATVDLGGYDRTCNTSSSSTSMVGVPAKARKTDEYGAIKPADEHARLDNYTIELQNDPLSQAYILTYGYKTSASGAAQKAADKAKSYLVNTRGIAADRIVTNDGGYRKLPATELWIVPSGAVPPAAAPTVDPSEVRSPKKPVKKPVGKKH
jgi:hypothetical protein